MVPMGVKADVLVKRQTGVPEGGGLPIVLWFTRQPFLNAQSARSDPRLQEALAFVASTYAAVGIKVGPISYFDLTGPDAEALAVPTEATVGDLFAKANDSDLPGVHYFMIDHFNYPGGGTVFGQAGGIPGPPAFRGLPHGGVAVALAYPQRGGTQLGVTMAHEGGHYLGLSHITERNGLRFDALFDTPECHLADSDANGDKLVVNEECQGKGADHLMFWTANRDLAVLRSKISNDQRFVILRNPSVQ
jgi:hypothetical protein